MKTSYITIDGSYGEGGGQILRSALAMSVIHSRPVEIVNIRKGRKKSGLQPQHLACVNASRDISDAHAEGNVLGSEFLRFCPGDDVKGGSFSFDVAEMRGSAGSTSLVLQTLMPALIFASHPSKITLMGGTHVPWSPPFHYLKNIFLPVAERMGCSFSLFIDQWGWYPMGGGVVHAEINPSAVLNGIRIEERGELISIKGVSAVSNLPVSIAERQRSEGLKILRPYCADTEIEITSAPSKGKGTFFFIIARYEGVTAGFSSLGAIGKSSEQVAREACREFLDYHKSQGAVDPHLADQLIPYIAISKGPSSFTTTKITKHLLTNIWTVRQFIDADIKVSGSEGDWGRVVKS